MVRGSLVLLVSGAIASLYPLNTLAQIVPDDSLGNERSLVRQNTLINGVPGDRIEGGSLRGSNLFHSFETFNVADGQRVYFAVPSGVDRILGRVTGNGRSLIDGTVGTLGNADLFLINPNGILFGRNARLDVGGSFVASTAAAIVFPDQIRFSTVDPQAPPLLTISAPIGLQYQGSANPIQVQGANLQVPDGNMLALLGGNVRLEETTLLAAGGRVELGGLRRDGTLELSANAAAPGFSFPTQMTPADISLSDGTSVEVLGTGSGSIAINAGNLNFSEASRLMAGIAPDINGETNPIGNIQINAAGTVNLNDSEILMFVSTGAVGTSGNVNIRANGLNIFNGGQINITMNGQGTAGDVNLDVVNAVRLGRISPAGFVSAIFSTVGPTNPNARGNAGRINISAGSVSLDDSAGLSTVLFDGATGKAGEINVRTRRLTLANFSVFNAASFGQGDSGNISIDVQGPISLINGSAIANQVFPNAIGNVGNITISAHSLSLTGGSEVLADGAPRARSGNITVRARDFIRLIGIGTTGIAQGVSSGLFSDTSSGSSGVGGTIQVTTPDLFIADGAVIDAGSRNVARGGDIAVDVERLSMVGGGQILTTAKNDGRAGDISIRANSIALSGFDPGFEARLARFGPEVVDQIDAASGIFANTITGSTGRGGSISIRSNTVQLQEQARIAVDSRGSGEGGRMQVQTNVLSLRDRAAISAETQSSTGGNITLNVPELLLLRRGSSISTTAGIAQGRGDGGNINLATGFIVAVPQEDSDITANAFRGNGGNINITTQNLFGLNFRDRQTPASDITASSRFGIDGNVTINTLTINPIQGTIELPTLLSPPPIAQGCEATSRTSRFVNTGRGGLPTNPADPLVVETLWQDLGEPEPSAIAPPSPPALSQTANVSSAPSNSLSTSSTSLVEAQGWITHPDGTVMLTASASTVIPHGIGLATRCDPVLPHE